MTYSDRNKMIVYVTKVIYQFKRRKIIACIALAVLFCVVILQTDFSLDLYFIHWGPFDNISCYNIESDNTLPRAHGESFQPPARSIFFHETSCKGDIDTRQACAVESAARTHPDWQINVLFLAPVTQHALDTGRLAVLRNLTNVKLLRVNILKYAIGTPLESMVAGGALNRTRWRISHTSDVMRYLSLYKFSGIYLDLDVVVAKPLDSLSRNWAAKESDRVVAAGAMAFSNDEIGRQVAEAAIRDIKTKYRGDDWGNNGPGVITRVLKQRCITGQPRAMSAATCDGFEVYGSQFFYPVHWMEANVYFEPGEIDEMTPYVFHVWNKKTSNSKVYKGSPLSRIAKKYCPDIYRTYSDEFGQ